MPNTHETQTPNTNLTCNQSSSLKIFTSNVRGLIKHWDSIKQINYSKYDVLIFNEIWQVRDYENLSIPDFIVANCYQRNGSRGGGAIIFIRDTIKFTQLESPVQIGTIETTAIKIKDKIIVALYRPPSGNKNEFIELLSNWLTNLSCKKFFLAGDFNINYLSQDRVYFDTLESNSGLKPCINDITRVISGSCIDNVVTNIPGSHKVSTICIADHQGLISNIKMKVDKLKTEKYKYREMKEINWSKFSTSTITMKKINQNQKTNLIFTVRNQTVVLVHDLHFAEQNFNLEAKRTDVKVKK